MASIDETALFKPKASKSEAKADVTTRAAQAIIDDEAAKRDAKTARLRQARIDAEAKADSTEAPAAKPRAAKTTAIRRAKSSR